MFPKIAYFLLKRRISSIFPQSAREYNENNRIDKTGCLSERNVPMDDKTNEQLPEESAQKMPEERSKDQDQMVKNIQALIANEGLFSRMIDFLPFPLAIFTSDYTLVMVNKAFTVQTQRVPFEDETVRIHPFTINDVQLAAAIIQVFKGDTFFLSGLRNPFSIFSGISAQSNLQPNHFTRAVIFPIPSDETEIRHSVIMFMP